MDVAERSEDIALKRADELEAQANALRDEIYEARRARLAAKPVLERLIYAAYDRCHCGAGMAYDPTSRGDGPFKGPSKWECGDILRFNDLSEDRQAQVKAATHTGGLPFAFYEIKSETQPSAAGASTRPKEGE